MKYNKENYISPMSEIVEIRLDGVIAQSASNTSIDDYSGFGDEEPL